MNELRSVLLSNLPNSSALPKMLSNDAQGLTLTQTDAAVDLHEQHSLEVCLLSTGCQLPKSTVQHTPHIFWEVSVRGDVAPPQIIQKLQASKASLRLKPT